MSEHDPLINPSADDDSTQDRTIDTVSYTHLPLPTNREV